MKADIFIIDDYMPFELEMLRQFLWATGFETCYYKSDFAKLAVAVEDFKRELRKTSLGRFLVKLIEIKVRIDIYLTCIIKGHHPIWYDIGTDNSYKYCLRCKKRWYRYKDGN